MDGERRRHVPTFTRVWQYKWLIRGIPNGPTFWRPIEGRAAIVFGVVMVAEWIILRRLGFKATLVSGLLVYVFIPGLAAWWATKARLGGKRLDRWLRDRLEYRFGPKQYDRFRNVARATYDLSQGGDSSEQGSTPRRVRLWQFARNPKGRG